MRVAIIIFISVILTTLCGIPVLADEPLTIQGVSFGMSKEDALEVLSYQKGELIIEDDGMVLSPVSFSKYTNATFGCGTHEDSVVLMYYELKEEISGFLYLQQALTKKYGEPVDLLNDYINRLTLLIIDQKNITNDYLLVLRRELYAFYSNNANVLFWNKDGVYISLSYKDGNILIVYLDDASSLILNTDDL